MKSCIMLYYRSLYIFNYVVSLNKIFCLFYMQNSPCEPCLVHCCLHWCAVCQEHREMKARLDDNFVMPMTLVNAPPVQQMNSSSTSSSSANVHEHHTNLQMQALWYNIICVTTYIYRVVFANWIGWMAVYVFIIVVSTTVIWNLYVLLIL